MPKRLELVPKHLQKPDDAIDIYQRYAVTVADGATETVIDRTNTTDRHVEIIPLISNENMFGTIEYWYYVNGSKILYWGTASLSIAAITEGLKVSDYLLQNPIKLKPGDTLRVDVKNGGASPVGIALHVAGWSYLPDEEIATEETEPEGETVEVET